MKRTLTLLAVCATMLLALTGCDQMMARSWGGTTTVTQPAGTQLVTMTWKGTSLWMLYYEPATKRCRFVEDSAGGVMQGEVVVQNCNPLMLAPATPTPPVPKSLANHG